MDSETESRYETLLSSIGDGVIATDTEGKIIFVNRAAENSLGWKSDELLGRKFQEVLGLYNNEGTAVSFQERPFEIALTTGRSTTTSATAAITSTDAIYFYQRKNKTRFPVAITVTAIILDKNIVGTIEVFRDITKEIELDNVKAEDQKKIEMAEAKDEATLASIGSGIIAVDEQGHVVAMSRMAEKMLGWQLKEIKGGDLHEIVPVTDESGNRVLKDNRPMHVALTTGTDTTTSSIGTATYFYARKDDTRFPVRIAVTPIILGGKIIGAIDNFQDITEERNFAATLAEAKARDEALLASIGDGMIATDRAGIITTVNHAAEVLLRCVGKDFLGKKLHEIVAVYDEKGVPPPPEKRPIQIALTTGKTTMTTCFYERKDGTRLHVALTVAPVLLGNNIVGAINIFQDVAKK